MKYAIVDGQRREAAPGLGASCSACGSAMIAKCGALREWHWAHRSRRICDPWWEGETQWHRDWKNAFSAAWQEVVQPAPDGEKHIADVKTASGMVLEFQHSPLSLAERQAREAFYHHLVWVVDGLRRSRDGKQFFEALQKRCADPPIFSVWRDESALVRDWAGSRVPVYFDFGTSTPDGRGILWRLQPGDRNCMAYVTPVSKAAFIAAHLEGEPSEVARTALVALVLEASKGRSSQSRPLLGFERYLARRHKERRRF